MKPTKKQIEKWVAALRSGKYQQTEGSLQNIEGFCCLGVACKEFAPEYTLNALTNFLSGQLPDSNDGAPEWLELIDDDFKNRVKDFSLSDLNDGIILNGVIFLERHSFDEIADLLEAVYIHEVL